MRGDVVWGWRGRLAVSGILCICRCSGGRGGEGSVCLSCLGVLYCTVVSLGVEGEDGEGLCE